MAPTPQRRSLLALIEAAGPLPPLLEDSSLDDTTVPPEKTPDITRHVERGFLEEVNLLEGLSTGMDELISFFPKYSEYQIIL